jgi:predicted nucleotidyltransferase
LLSDRVANMSEEIIAVGPILPLELGEAVKTAFRDDDYAVLVEQLESIVGKVITGLIVYGSMARRSQSRQIGGSDVDLLVLVQDAASGGVFGRADNIDIDLHVHSRNVALSGAIADWALYAEGRVLFDLCPPELEAWLRNLALWKRENPDPWTEADHLRDHVWAQRMLERIIRLSPIDPTVAAMHEARLLATIPTLYAQVKRKHTTSISKWWATLAHENPVFANALASYTSKRSFPPDGAALQQLLNELYGPEVTTR